MATFDHFKVRNFSVQFVLISLLLFGGSTILSSADEPYGWFFIDYRGPNNQSPEKTTNHWITMFGGDYLSSVAEPVMGSGLVPFPNSDGSPSNPPDFTQPDDIWSYRADSVTTTSAADAILAEQFKVLSLTTTSLVPAGTFIENFQLLNLSANYFGVQYTSFDVQIDLATESTFANILASDTLSIVPLTTPDSAEFVTATQLIDTVIEANTTYYFRLSYFNSGSTNSNVRIMGDDFLFAAVIPEPSTYAMIAMALSLGLLVLRRRGF